MSLTLKIGSLFIRTLAKPIANGIKRSVQTHEGFRRRCVNFAQTLHRFDVRWRVGLLQDPAVIEKQIQRELKEAEARRRAARAPTVKTEAETKADEQALKEEKKALTEKHKPRPPKVRPLTEAKAIDMGATFLSEAFMFLVAGGIIVFEQWRSRRKASDRRDVVDEKLVELEMKNAELLEEIKTLKTQVATVAPQKEETQKLAPKPKQTTPPTSAESSPKTDTASKS